MQPLPLTTTFFLDSYQPVKRSMNVAQPIYIRQTCRDKMLTAPFFRYIVGYGCNLVIAAKNGVSLLCFCSRGSIILLKEEKDFEGVSNQQSGSKYTLNECYSCRHFGKIAPSVQVSLDLPILPKFCWKAATSRTRR